MDVNNHIDYLAATDQLDEFLGMKKEEKDKCINCSDELKKIKENLLYCQRCGFVYEKNGKDDVKALNYKISQLGI